MGPPPRLAIESASRALSRASASLMAPTGPSVTHRCLPWKRVISTKLLAPRSVTRTANPGTTVSKMVMRLPETGFSAAIPLSVRRLIG